MLNYQRVDGKIEGVADSIMGIYDDI